MFLSRYAVSLLGFEKGISRIQGDINPRGEGEFNFSRSKLTIRRTKPRLNFITSETDDRTKKYKLNPLNTKRRLLYLKTQFVAQ